MDRYGREDILVGKAIIEINTWHHENPRRMITRSYWYLCKSGWVGVSAMWIGVYLVTETVSWQWWFVGILGANANIVHQWAHKFPNEKPALLTGYRRLESFNVLTIMRSTTRNQKRAAIVHILLGSIQCWIE